MDKIVFLASLFLLILLACKDEGVEQPDYTCSDCLNLSELKTQNEYYSEIELFDNLYKSDLRSATLNGIGVEIAPSLNIADAGYYELKIEYLDNSVIEDTTYQFVIIDAERGESEWGLMKWTPPAISANMKGNEDIDIIFPKKVIEGTQIPVMFKVKDGVEINSVYGKCNHKEQSFNIKRGIGSIQFSPAISEPNIFDINGRQLEVLTPHVYSSIEKLNGTISENTVLEKDKAYEIDSDLIINAGTSLTISEGVTVIIHEAINIYNYGQIIMRGSEQNSILITSKIADKYWGGFISSGNSAQFSAEHVFFCRSGYHHTGEYAYGHAGRQALFRIDQSTIELNDCYILDNIGQIFYPTNSTLNLLNLVVQRAKTGGELSYSEVVLSNSYFSDFPDDSHDFRDDDNDALYLSNTNATISGTSFMYAKDDGLDTGSDNGGVVNISDCHFEACFHEGLALSCYKDSYKRHIVENCVFTKNGQGLEMGFSSRDHIVSINNCLFTKNLIGIRYGDNYTWALAMGTMTVSNSLSVLNKDKDVWNMTRTDWGPKTDNLLFENTRISIPSEQYPNLELIN